MRQFPGRKFILIAFLACLSVPISSAADQKLLSLVPPIAQIVARISAQTSAGTKSNFVVITHNNGVDLEDFFALSGADSTRSIHEVIFTAAEYAGQLSEHSLLASGNFDQKRIYRSAVDNGSSTAHYRAVSVLVVPPFVRDRSEFGEVRWLAIPEPDVLLFGSIVSVQQELDRYLTHGSVDSRLTARLGRLRRDNATWCVLSLSAWSPEIRSALAVIDRQLAARLKDGDALQFGIRYGRHVEFEYEIMTASATASSAISDRLTQSLTGPEVESSLLTPPDRTLDSNIVRGVIKVSMARYNAWLAEISERGLGPSTASP